MMKNERRKLSFDDLTYKWISVLEKNYFLRIVLKLTCDFSLTMILKYDLECFKMDFKPSSFLYMWI